MNTINGIEIPNIPKLMDEMRTRSNERYPARNVWASMVGDPCARRLVYEQVAWKHKPLPDAGLLRIFALGRLHGKQIFRDLEDALEPHGIRVEQGEVRTPDNEFGISGKIDAILSFESAIAGERRVDVPCEIKSTQPHTLSKIDSVADLRHSDAVYLQRYADQLLSYVHLLGAPFGLFFFREKATGKDKQIICERDEERWTYISQRAAAVNLCVEQYKTAKSAAQEEVALPARVPWTSAVCGRCPFVDICVPDMSGREGVADYLGEDEANEVVNGIEELKANAKTHDALRKRLSKFVSAATCDLENGESLVLALPDYDVTATVGSMTRYELDDEAKQKYSTRTRVVRTKITAQGAADTEHEETNDAVASD